MIRMERYVHSKRPYAVDLGSFTVEHRPREKWLDQRGGEHWSREYWRCRIEAVWFRGKVGAPEACIGEFRWSVGEDPLGAANRERSAARAVEAYQDGTYGGDCLAKLRSDDTMWFADRTATADMLSFEDRLTPILAGFPEVPAGWSGWWRFPTNAELRASR